MAQVTVRVTRETRDEIGKLSRAEGRSMQSIVERAVREYVRTATIEGINEAYARLRADPGEAGGADAERALWDATSSDGIDGGDGKARAMRRTQKRGPRGSRGGAGDVARLRLPGAGAGR